MTFTFEETPDSRQETADPARYTLIYKASGEFDNDTVANYAAAGTPTLVFRSLTGTLYRSDIQLDPDGWSQYIVTVTYERPDQNAGGLPVGTTTFAFDTTGATVNVKVAREHVASFPAIPNLGNPHKGAINVKEDGEVDGVDIVIPALKLTYTRKHALGVIDENYARQQASVTGMTNANVFRGFQPEELLYLGASGSDGTNVEAECVYQFIASQNASGLVIGDIVDIVKAGHHYAWIEFKDEVAEGTAVRQPRRVHIERVYNKVDFPTVLGWS